MTFRDPHGISKVTPLCPEVNDVKIIYNVFEFNYDSNVDNCLVDLELFPKYRAGGKISFFFFQSDCFDQKKGKQIRLVVIGCKF